MTKAERVLREIERRGGMTFTEIQRFVCEMNGKDYDQMVDTWAGKKRRWRGYWCDYLIGKNHWGRKYQGILNLFCVKGSDSRYRVSEPLTSPWSFRLRKTQSYLMNEDRRRRGREAREAKLPICQGCGERVHALKCFAPDKLAHYTWYTEYFRSDCKQRIWSMNNELSPLSHDVVREEYYQLMSEFPNWFDTDKRLERMNKFLKGGN